jgi:hypothetical protein
MVRLATATGPGDRLEDRARQIERQHAGILDQHRIRLADQHGGEGQDHQDDEGESVQDQAHLAGNNLEIIPDRHVRPILLQAGCGWLI